MRLLVGGYTADMGGSATGVGMLRVERTLDYSDVVTLAGSPSWLARHPHLDVVYAGLEGSGEVQALARTGDRDYAPLGSTVAAGRETCHVTVAPDGAVLLASNYGDGRVTRMRLDADGIPGDPVALPPAHDPHPGAERASHAHQAGFLSAGVALTVDTGFDLVRVWRDVASAPVLAQQVLLPRGSGPRHIVRHASGTLFVVTEYSCEVYVLEQDAGGSWRIATGTPVGDVLTGDAAAGITTSSRGEFVYVGVRGSNTIATLKVGDGGRTLSPVGLVDAGADWPRCHLTAGNGVLVAGQRSDDVVALGIDDRTGVAGGVRARTHAPSPTSLLPLRA